MVSIVSTWQYEPVSVSAVALYSHKSLEVEEQDTGWRRENTTVTSLTKTYLPHLTHCNTDAIQDDSPFFSADSLCRQVAAGVWVAAVESSEEL